LEQFGSLVNMVSFGLRLGAFTLLQVAAFASPVKISNYAVKDFHPAPRGWSNVAAAPQDHHIDLSIGLTQTRFNELEQALYQGRLAGHFC
jgi:hypothetical protein